MNVVRPIRPAAYQGGDVIYLVLVTKLFMTSRIDQVVGALPPLFGKQGGNVVGRKIAGRSLLDGLSFGLNGTHLVRVVVSPTLIPGTLSFLVGLKIFTFVFLYLLFVLGAIPLFPIGNLIAVTCPIFFMPTKDRVSIGRMVVMILGGDFLFVPLPIYRPCAFFAPRLPSVRRIRMSVVVIQWLDYLTRGTHLCRPAIWQSVATMTRPLRRFIKSAGVRFLDSPAAALAIPPRTTINHARKTNDGKPSAPLADSIVYMRGNRVRILISHFATSFSVLVREALGTVIPGASCVFRGNYTTSLSRAQILEGAHGL